MVGMRVSVDDVLDRFIGNDLLDFSDDRSRGGFVLRRFDQNDVVFEFACRASVPAGDQIDAVGEFLIPNSRSATTTAPAAPRTTARCAGSSLSLGCLRRSSAAATTTACGSTTTCRSATC